jgi:hypothetical protein
MYYFDLIISGGGVKYFYMIGIKIVLDILERNNILKINRYSSLSSGCVSIVMMACNVNNTILIKKYKKYIILDKISKLPKLKLLQLFLAETLPDNAHLLCNNRVFITATELDYIPKKVIFSKYKSKKDLINKIMCSVSFPYFINKDYYYNLNNKKYIDGCFMINTPYFNNNTNQIIIKPFFVNKINLFSIESFSDISSIFDGFNDMKSHLLGNHILPIQWYNKKNIYQKLFEYIKYFILLKK